MKVFIFEGIATSGKSTIIQQLGVALSDLRLNVANEDETHMPIMKGTDDSHVDFFINLVEQKLSDNADIVIFDRLYLTQAFRSKSGINAYKQVEELLLYNNALTIFLKVNDNSIADRVHKASLHREVEWGEYIKTKGQSIEQIAEYYTNQQTNQLELLKTSTVPYVIFDTTEHNYKEIIDQVVAMAHQPNKKHQLN